MPQISVIVPVYNVEKYLGRCIDSILEQDFGDFELLLVDDGSTDGSSRICDEYAERNSKVKVFHKANGGVSSARNLGLDKACGELISFVDSDDWLDPDCLATLVSRGNVDLNIVNFTEHNDNGTLIPDRVDCCLSGENVLYDFLKTDVNRDSLRTPWGKLFRKEIIKLNNLRFDERLHTCEDTVFVLNYCLCCKSICLSSSPLYHYEYSSFNSSDSLSRDEKIFIRQYPLIFNSFRQINDTLKGRTGKEDNTVFSHYIYHIFYFTLNAILKKKDMRIMEEFSSDLNVRYSIDILGLTKVYGFKGNLTMRLLRNGYSRLAMLLESFPPHIG